jgi:RimJ/RimL family protein N-acetyltransferase
LGQVLREATEADVEMIRRWRDHPKVRAASIFTDEITPEGHARWWAAVCADPQRHVLIFEYDGTACGVVTINDHDPVAGTAEWGFFLDVDGLQGRGSLLPAWIELERQAVAYGFDDLKLRAMGGRTLAWNKPVLALHRRFGFVEVPDRGYVTRIGGVDQDVVWTELTAAGRG